MLKFNSKTGAPLPTIDLSSVHEHGTNSYCTTSKMSFIKNEYETSSLILTSVIGINTSTNKLEVKSCCLSLTSGIFEFQNTDMIVTTPTFQIGVEYEPCNSKPISLGTAITIEVTRPTLIDIDGKTFDAKAVECSKKTYDISKLGTYTVSDSLNCPITVNKFKGMATSGMSTISSVDYSKYVTYSGTTITV